MAKVKEKGATKAEGRVSQVIGAVVDVAFPTGTLPSLSLIHI